MPFVDDNKVEEKQDLEKPEETNLAEDLLGGPTYGTAYGLAKGAENIAETTATIAKAGYVWATEDAEAAWNVVTEDDVEIDLLPEEWRPVTTSGQLFAGPTQFLTGLMGPAKILKPLKLASKSKWLDAAAKGAVADFTSFGAWEQRASDFAIDMGLNNVVTQYLQADEDDTWIEGKLKNSIEGLGLGVVADGIFYAFKNLKHARKLFQSGKQKEAVEHMVDAMAEPQAFKGEPQKVKPKFEATEGYQHPLSDDDIDALLKDEHKSGDVGIWFNADKMKSTSEAKAVINRIAARLQAEGAEE